MTPRHRLMTAILGLAVLAGVLPALAQPKGHGPHGHGPGAMAGERLEWMAEKLELSEGQREELREAFATGFEGRDEAQRALFEARRALEEQIHADSFDEAAIREAARALAALEADGAVERARHAQKLRQILTPEQYAELEEMRSQRQRFGRRGHRHRGFGGPPPTGE